MDLIQISDPLEKIKVFLKDYLDNEFLSLKKFKKCILDIGVKSGEVKISFYLNKNSQF